MKSRITDKFEALRQQHKKALITYITAGDPSLEKTFNLVLEMEKAGADIIELGIPYSDPLADGPVIQRASERALTAGANMDKIFLLVESLRAKTAVPLVFLVYYNGVFQYGLNRFLDNCKRTGVDGLIIPDLPLEERQELQHRMKDYAIDLIPLVAPTSEERIKKIVEAAKGFVYCISSMGVTGKRDEFETDLSSFIQKIRKYTETPLALGFGIGTADKVKKLAPICDGVIVGSAIIEAIEEGLEDETSEERVAIFVKELYDAKNIA